MTTFPCPTLSNATELDGYSFLVAAHLFLKGFIEGFHDHVYGRPVAIEGPFAHDLSFDERSGFLAKVRSAFHHYYGQFITRQFFDLAMTIVPWLRFSNSTYWTNYFDCGPEDVDKYVGKLQRFEADGGGSDFIVEPDQYPIQWTMCATH